MSEYEPAVFVSYAWDGEREEIVNQIDQALQKRGVKIIRDKRDLSYKGSISEFMERIGQGNCVIVVISDKYLRSPNCMFELVEIAKNKDFYDRIFPIVLSDADIYNPVNRIKYIKHWEDRLKELDEAMKTVSSANLQGIRDEIDSYDEIRDNISRLTFLLKDMNTLTPAMHGDADFAQLYAALLQRIQATASTTQTATADVRIQVGERPATQMGTKLMDSEPSVQQIPADSSRIQGDQNISHGNVTSGGISFQGGRHNNITIHQSMGIGSDELTALFDKLYKHIESRSADPNVDKEEIVETVQKIQEEVSKGERAVNEAKLTRWLDTLNKIAPDVIDVALASLGGPISGITAVLKKISERARQQAQP